jgi:hypothetical protein
MTATTKPPVFIVGCPRSGTSLLYHMLLSSGAFAHFRTEMNVFNLLLPIFGDPRKIKNRTRMMNEWLQSKAFTASGLDAREIEQKVSAEGLTGGSFLRTIMDEICRRQNVDRWADSTPTNLLHIREINLAFPDARIIHVIRDGRDVALSLDRLGWVRPLPWDRDKTVLVGGLYWKWVIERGREAVRKIKPNYLEIGYENLVNQPRETITQVGGFLGLHLDLDRIQAAGVGALREPPSSFGKWGRDRNGGKAVPAHEPDEFKPVGRWQTIFSREELASFEALVGELLESLGYSLATKDSELNRSLAIRRARALYPLFFDSKQLVRSHTRLSRFFARYSAALVDK